MEEAPGVAVGAAGVRLTAVGGVAVGVALPSTAAAAVVERRLAAEGAEGGYEAGGQVTLRLPLGLANHRERVLPLRLRWIWT